MDPANPRPQATQGMSMSTVQRWVMSVLAVTTIGHFAAGLVFAAVLMHSRPVSARIGIDLIAGVVGILGVAAGFLIHEKSALTPWLLLGLLPAAVGLYLIL
jgi:tetrahydromethanopterin S-methyltransferase subunit F